MAEQSDMKVVSRVLVGPLIANNPFALPVLGVLCLPGGNHQTGNRLRDDHCGDPGDGVLQHVYLDDPPPYSQ